MERSIPERSSKSDGMQLDTSFLRLVSAEINTCSFLAFWLIIIYPWPLSTISLPPSDRSQRYVQEDEAGTSGLASCNRMTWLSGSAYLFRYICPKVDVIPLLELLRRLSFRESWSQIFDYGVRFEMSREL
jgi:hypothetical protein